MAGLFVTGTDTDCGKTLVSLGLMQALQNSGLRVNGYKPVAAGSEPRDGRRVNGDAWQLWQQSTSAAQLDYQQINPYLFDPPVAPHLAAAGLGVSIELPVISAAFDALQARADVTLVEGAGGWLVPLNATDSVADIARQLSLPVILVVGLKLGCINHARLSLEAIRQSGCHLMGWVGSCIDPDMLESEGNIATLKSVLDCPCLGIVPFLSQPTAAGVAGYLELSDLELLS